MSRTENPTKSNKKAVVVIAIALVLILGLGINRLFFSRDFLYAGTLEVTLVDLSAQLQSPIRSVSVYEGDHVLVNQELVILSCDDYKSDAKLANDNYQRNHRLYLKGAIPEDTLEKFLNAKEDAEIRVGWCTVKAPIEGTVLNRYHEPGEYVSAGVKMLTLANIRDIWAYIYVPMPEVSKLSVGMKVVGIIPEMNNQEFEGKIIKINSEAEFTPKNVQTRSERTRLIYGIKVSFLGANEEEILKPGMTIEIKLPKE